MEDEARETTVDEVQRRMDVVVDTAVEWHQSGSDSTGEQFAKAEALSTAIDSLLELRYKPDTGLVAVDDHQDKKGEQK